MALHIIFACVSLLLLLASIWWWWSRWLSYFEKPHVKLWGNGGEVLLAFMMAALGSGFELYKSETWSHPKVSTVWGSAGTLGILGVYASLKMLNYKAKDRDSGEIERLKLELGTVRRQRDWATRIRELIAKIVETKMLRIRRAWLDGALSGQNGFLQALDPISQIHQILVALHRTYEIKLPANEQLRLAVYLRQNDLMAVMFGWDGKSQECFSKGWNSYMKISDPEGSRSLIMDLYHSQKTFRIVPDCEQAAKEGSFVYFRPEQSAYLKSMVAMKKVIHTDQKDIIILTLDASAAGFFSEEEKDDIEMCCSEILKRLEFELLVYSIVTDQASQSSTSEQTTK